MHSVEACRLLLKRAQGLIEDTHRSPSACRGTSQDVCARTQEKECRYAALCCLPELGPKQAHGVVGAWPSLGALLAAYQDPARCAPKTLALPNQSFITHHPKDDLIRCLAAGNHASRSIFMDYASSRTSIHHVSGVPAQCNCTPYPNPNP